MTAKFAPGAVYTADDPISWPAPTSPISGAAHIISVIDCSTNPNYPDAVQGDIYKVSVAGRLGGAAGAQVDAGDVAIAMVESAAGNQATVGANWAILEHNLVGALLAANNLSDVASAITARGNLGLGTVAVLASDTDGTLTANSDLRVATQKAVVTFVNTQIATAGAGDVVGPASAVNGNFPVFNGTTGKLVSDSGVAPANFVQTTRTVNGHALSANVTVTASDVGLGSVTNDAQTKAAIVPNTAPGAGQLLVGNLGATAYAAVSASGAVTVASTGAFSLATPATLTVSTANAGGTTAHTHAITSSSAPGAAASLLATDASGIIGTTGARIVKIWALDLTVTNAIAASITGSAATLTTSRNINGVAFNGSADITVTAAAGTLTGATLAAGVTASSLTSVGTLTALTVSGTLTPQALIDASGASAGQIKFPATQNPSADANTLDDYEEGSWTPVLTFATPGTLSVAYTTQAGQYTKIGRQVFLNFQVITSSFTLGTASGVLTLSGLPFTSAAGFSQSAGSVLWGGITKAGFTQVCPTITFSATTITFQAAGSGAGTANVNATDTPTGGSMILRGQISYFI